MRVANFGRFGRIASKPLGLLVYARDWWRTQSAFHKLLIALVALLLVARLFVGLANTHALARVNDVNNLIDSLAKLEGHIKSMPIPDGFEANRPDGSVTAYNQALSAKTSELQQINQWQSVKAGNFSATIFQLFTDKSKETPDAKSVVRSVSDIFRTTTEQVEHFQSTIAPLERFFAYDPGQDFAMYSKDKAEAKARIKNAQDGLSNIRNKLGSLRKPRLDPNLDAVINELDAHINYLSGIESQKDVNDFVKKYRASKVSVQKNRSQQWQDINKQLTESSSKLTLPLLDLRSYWQRIADRIPG